MKCLFLDDERIPSDVFWNGAEYQELEWVVVRNSDEFKQWIEQNGIPDLISFDNDLGLESLEGYECAKWLCEDYCLRQEARLQGYLVHSKNNVNHEKILSYLQWFEQNYEKFF